MAEPEKKKDEKEGEAAVAAPAPAKNNKKLFIIIGCLVALVLLLGVPAVAFFVLKKSPSATDQLPADAASAATPENKGILEGSDEEADIQDGEEIPGAMLPLDTFVVNLLNGNKYVRCQVQLEFTEREVPKKFYAKLVPLRDAMITMLSNRTPEELSVQKGRDQLKADLKELVNEYLKKEVVKQVYFTQFVIQ